MASLSVPLTHSVSLAIPFIVRLDPCPSTLPATSPPLVARCSEPTEAEQCGDEHAKRHKDGEHEAAVVGGIGVGCPGP